MLNFIGFDPFLDVKFDGIGGVRLLFSCHPKARTGDSFRAIAVPLLSTPLPFSMALICSVNGSEPSAQEPGPYGGSCNR